MKTFLTILITALIVGAGAFYGGMRYQKSSLASQGLLRDQSRGQGQGGRQFGGGGRGPGGGQGDFTAGEITAKDDKSLTIKTRDGSSKIVYFSDSTTIGKSTQGSLSDLNTGQQIMANGKNNPDGSLSAQNIQVRPGGGPGGPGQTN